MPDPQQPISEQDFNAIVAEVAAKAPKGLSETQFNQLIDAAVRAKTTPPASLGGFAANAWEGAKRLGQTAADTVQGLGEGAQLVASGGGAALADPSIIARIANNPVVQGGTALVRGVGDAMTAPFYPKDQRMQQSAAVAGKAAKDFGHSLTGQGFYEDPVNSTLNIAGLAAPIAGAAERVAGAGNAISRGAGRMALKLTPPEEAALPEMLPTFQQGNANVSAGGVRNLERQITPLQARVNRAVQNATDNGVTIDIADNPALNARVDHAHRRVAANQPNYEEAVAVRDRLLNAHNTSEPVYDIYGNETGRQPINIDPVLNTDLKRQYYQNVGQKYQPNAVDDARSAAYKAAAHDRMAAENEAVPETRPLNDELGPLMALQNRINSLLKAPGSGISFQPTHNSATRNVLSMIAPYTESLVSRGAYQGARAPAAVADFLGPLSGGEATAGSALNESDRAAALRRAILGQ